MLPIELPDCEREVRNRTQTAAFPAAPEVRSAGEQVAAALAVAWRPAPASRYVIHSDPPSVPGRARSFEGEGRESGLSVLLVDAPPGEGPRLRRHPYSTAPQGFVTEWLEAQNH